MRMTKAQRDVTRRALLAEARNLERQYQTAVALSEPCPPGRWRWADVDTSGYHKKTAEQLQAMYEMNQQRVPVLQAELAAVQGALAALGSA